jgi:hypothetical protein
MIQTASGNGRGIASVSRVASASDSTNKPIPLGSFPSVSVLQSMSLVNGRISGGAVASNKNSTDWDGIPSTDILSRLAAIEKRLDQASIDAVCENGTVTVTLNL